MPVGFYAGSYGHISGPVPYVYVNRHGSSSVRCLTLNFKSLKGNTLLFVNISHSFVSIPDQTPVFPQESAKVSDLNPNAKAWANHMFSLDPSGSADATTAALQPWMEGCNSSADPGPEGQKVIWDANVLSFICVGGEKDVKCTLSAIIHMSIKVKKHTQLSKYQMYYIFRVVMATKMNIGPPGLPIQ